MNTPALHTLDPLTLPLTGLQLIEASAGTGKTWTLAALYVRLVLGHAPGDERLGAGWYPPQILVMTFTEAATAELRERVRERLTLAARFFDTGAVDQADDFLRALRHQLAPDQWPLAAQRLGLAAQWMDEAAIFTIHGWSSRMLKTHAFDSASLFTQSRVEDSERLRLVAAQDYWRHWFYALDGQALAALKGVGESPQALLDRLKALWRAAERAPAAEAPPPEAPDAVLARWSVWQQQRLALERGTRALWTLDVVQLLNDAAAAKAFKGVRQDYFAGWMTRMADWAQGEDIEIKTLERFGAGALAAKGWAEATRHAVFDQVEALHALLVAEPDVSATLLAHAALEVDRAYQRAKEQAAQFDFSDLLQHLYRALQAPDGRLASAIRTQYPVALVDEFQDTDPWQFGSLGRIYGDASDGATGLIMIGDPKQAIYSFRGADLATYLTAREQARGIYTLPGNYRSTPAVVAAVNQMFGHAEAPFGSVPFVPVAACNPAVQPLLVAGRTQAAMTVWHLPYAKPPRKPVFLADMAAVFATHMVTLLQDGAAQPGQMAVLVRDWREAAAVRAALSARGVRSVYLSERDSVYASPQAHDLWRILRAVANPGSTRAVRAALATRSWGLAWPALEALLADESAWDGVVEQCMQWQRVWREQGFLPMLYRLLHDQGLPARLLQHSTQGERALTNLLHLGELLQAASLELQGEGALIRYLEDQLRRPQSSGEAAQLRLESDADLVQVVTLHKSKGLEYPLVFLPFMSNFRAEEKHSERADDERLAEDIRLFYVAVTRARQALWLGVAQLKGDVDGKTPQAMSAISKLLGRTTPGDLWTSLQVWACDAIAVRPAPEPNAALYQAPQPAAAEAKPARLSLRRFRGGWWSASFSALTRELVHEPLPQAVPSERDERLGDAQIDNALPDPATERGVDDAPDLFAGVPPLNAFPAGSQYGTLLHDLLEWQARNGWPAAQLDAASAAPATLAADWTGLLARQSQRFDLLPEHSAMLEDWVRQIVTAALPLRPAATDALQLDRFQAHDLWPEMGFALPVQRLGSQQLDALISRQLWPRQLRPTLQRRQLEGMLTGFMDLVLLHQGRYYVLDYKSNRLPGYDPAQLQLAMLAHRYDVQAVLYLLALHRLLKSRLPDYDYDQHVGGALYLFLRGIDQPGAGLLHLSPSRALIEALDTAFAQTPLPKDMA